MKLKENQPAIGALGAPCNMRRPGTLARAAAETCPMSAETLQAIRLLKSQTAGRFDLWSLAGRHNAGRRAQVMSALVGTRTPQAKAGVNALRAAFYKALGIVGDCEAEREENFRFVAEKRSRSNEALYLSESVSTNVAEIAHADSMS